jgi:hypothetical protein
MYKRESRYSLMSALILTLLAYVLPSGTSGAPSDSLNMGKKWVAAWTTPISSAFARTSFPPGFSPATIARFRQPEFDSALLNGEAYNQTFRMIIRPDIWGDTIRVRFSNQFGTHDLALSSAVVGLQEYGAFVLAGSNRTVTFGGKNEVTIPPGRQVLSDPVHLTFVTKANMKLLAGRSLAVGFAVSGESGPLSAHAGGTISYIGRRDAGDHAREEDDSAFPYTTTTYFLVGEVDVLSDVNTIVICALGDSVTDLGGYGGSTVNGYDGWSDELSHRVHKVYGDRVSVVNMGVGGNTVVTDIEGFGGSQPMVKRLDRDVLGISGLSAVVWLERGGSGFSDRGVSGYLSGQYSNRRADIHEKAKT